MTDWGSFGAVNDLSTDELRQRLRSLQSIFAKAPVPIAIAHDTGCRFISANAALATLLGLAHDKNISLTPPPGEVAPYRIQRNGVDIPAAELPMQFCIARAAFVTNEIEIIRADGSVVYVQNDVEPLFDSHGQIYGCVSVCVDHTHRKLAEIALREADRRKDEFLATLSHELRNPLAPIRTALEVMRLAPHNAELVTHARVTMERQLTHMVRITDDLLDVARITQNKVSLRRERVDLCAIVNAAVDAARTFIDAQGHTLELKVSVTPVWIDGDVTRLTQVLTNVLNNAAKYTDPGGRILVSAVDESGEAAVVVSDTGVGIPATLLPRIFDMFTQLPSDRDRAQGGLGIGLTLARRLVELHGGRIEAASDGLGLGSRFVIRLPVALPEIDDAPAPVVRHAPLTVSYRVLVADDNHDALAMMELMLEMKGHQVRVAADGLQAVAIAEAFAPHIAFFDIGMPRMDGYEAARRVRAKLGSQVKLVALTGWGQDEDKQRSFDAGFDHHLTKPFEPDVLEHLIASCVEGGGAQRSGV